MNDILCSICGIKNDHNNVKCEECKTELLRHNSPCSDNWEDEFQFIEEAEMQGNVFEISVFDDALCKMEMRETTEIQQDIKHEPEIQIEHEIDKQLNFDMGPLHLEQSMAKPYKCPSCTKGFKREAALKAHINFEHKSSFDEHLFPKLEKKIIKNMRKEKNGNVSELLNSGFWKCSECDMMFSVKFDFKMHKNQHEGKEVFQCDVCQAYLSNNKILMDHKRKLHDSTVNTEKKFLCTICGERFSLQVFLSNHKKTHIEFINQLRATANMERVNGRITYTCKECGKASSNRSRHEEHLRVHTKERPFKCSLCGAEFTAASSMVLHKRLHSDERPFKCEICSETYRHKKNLVRHLLKHSGQLPFKCRFCDRAFSTNSIKKDHERLRHTGETPYQCEKCEKRFKTSLLLNAHRRTEHDIITNSKRKVEILIKKVCTDKKKSRGNS